MVYFLIVSIVTLVAIAAICDKSMDKWMIQFINESEYSQSIVNPCWFSFNPLAKWKNGKWGVEKADNVLLLKLGIKTKLLTDNCNDGWHFFKSTMIVCEKMSMVLFMALGAVIGVQPILYYILTLGALGFIWNFTFNKYKHENTF